jgi:hypothetical protein
MDARSSCVEKSAHEHTLSLTFLLTLFCLRVIGQIWVALFLIIGLFVKIIRDISSGAGFFAQQHPQLGQRLRTFGVLYLFVMLLRYAIRMFLYSNERWTGGSLPIFFHCVLAIFIITWGSFYLNEFPKRVEVSKRHRGSPRRLLPATPPCVRVRTRRFDTIKNF